MTVQLRPLETVDLDQVYDWERDPRAVEMAAFTRPDPSDRAAFDTHYRRVRENRENTLLAIDEGDGLVGTIGSYTMMGDRQVTYWIDPSRWGQGLATAALGAFLGIELTRPLHAHVAAHNIGSATVLTRAGFVRVDRETSPAQGVGRDVVEHIYRLS